MPPRRAPAVPET
ncbi:hypothetical protein A2U01_0097253, partial [Trifolium medium]|nr:hypothetical protein [Trifolium medium]